MENNRKVMESGCGAMENRRRIVEDRYNVECCDLTCPHESAIQRVRERLPDEDTLYDLTGFYTPSPPRNCAYAILPRCWG